MEKVPYFVNAHAHCFTVEHVPDQFTKTLTWFSWLFTIKFIRKYRFVRFLINVLNKKLVKSVLKFITPSFADSLPRLFNFAEFFEVTDQKGLVNELQSHYPTNMKFVLLTMDMEYMAAGKPAKEFQQQLDEVAAIKADPLYRDIIYPFVFADPRRPGVTGIVKGRLEDKTAPFQGIKIYPALGYYPFDERLKEVYLHAQKHQTPITTHCIRGAVYYRGNKTDDPSYLVHPYTHKPLPFSKASEFTVNFTHPYNYECLLNPKILHSIWPNSEDIDLSDLKICLGHYGGEDEWLKYLQDSWLPDRYFSAAQTDSLDVKNNLWYDEPDSGTSRGRKAYSWFSIICEMMRRYPNVYADISYTLCEPRILPLLKILLQSDPNDKNGISSRILFGTDFYVVSKAGAEREMSLYVRAYLGEELWTKIAYENPKKFLNL